MWGLYSQAASNARMLKGVTTNLWRVSGGGLICEDQADPPRLGREEKLTVTNVQDRIRELRASLTRAEALVAKYLSAHPTEAAFLPAARIGEKAGVSESTVFRFTKSLGYSSFQELQAELQADIRLKLHEATPIRLRRTVGRSTSEWAALTGAFEDDIKNIQLTSLQLTEPSFRDVIDALAEARGVWVVGLRGATALATLLGYTLNLLRPEVHFLADRGDTIYDRLVDLRKGDVLLATAFSRQSRRTLEAVELARTKGATVIAITDDVVSPLATAADHALIVAVQSRAFIQSYTAAVSLAHGLFAALGLRLQKAASERLKNLEAELFRFNVFREEPLDLELTRGR